MKSMTGYGWSEFQSEKIGMICEIKSYNNRYLDIIINIPPFLSPLDNEMRKWIKGRVGRGRVELTVRIKDIEENIEVIVDRLRLGLTGLPLKEISEAAALKERAKGYPISLSLNGILERP